MMNRNQRKTRFRQRKGADRNGFSCVGHTEGLDEPGVIFSYPGYVRMIEANLSYYLNAFFNNIK